VRVQQGRAEFARSRAAEADADQALVERSRGGDEDAFAALVNRYGQPVLSLCYGSTLDAAEAEDLAQEVFLSAWRHLGRFRGESAFSTWLFALARNACVDRARRARHRPRVGLPDELADQPAARDPVDRATVDGIFAAAGSLSVPLRQALLLRDLQGLSYEEIAALQAVPIGTVRSRIAAARTAVAEAVSR
jgi:RNA polymerase sigma-70 factor (ECF subfamily)